MATVLILAPGGALSAQMGGAPADTLTVGLNEVLEMARRSNPALRRAENALDQNGPERRSTLMGSVLPNLTVNLLNTGYRGNVSFQAFDNFGDPIQKANADWSYFSNTSQSVNLNWSVQGLSIFNALKEQDLSEETRFAALESADWALMGDVRRQYFDAMQQLELVRVEEGLAEGRQVDLESAERRFGLAQASRVDVLNAEVQIEQQEIAIRQARTAYDQALLALRTTIGDPDAPALRVETTQLPIFDPSSLQEDELLRLARGENPALREAEMNLRSAQVALDRQGERWWPTLFAQYTLGRAVNGEDFQGFTDLSHDRTDLQSNFNIGISFNLFNNWFQDEAQEAQARVQAANQEESRREQLLLIEQSVRTELINLRNQYESLQLAERSASIAAEASELARGEYRIGTRTFTDLQQTLRQEADAARSVIQARYGFVDALLALEAAVGAPIRPAGAN